jgi:hypothetical protein
VEYIKKIFQVPFNLYPISTDNAWEYLQLLTSSPGMDADQKVHIQNVVGLHIPHLTAQGNMNPREVKRFINAYTLQLQLNPNFAGADPYFEASRNALLAMNALEFRADWQPFLAALLGLREEALKCVADRIATGNEDALEILPPSARRVPEDLLVYLGPTGPGNALLTVTDLAPFIYATSGNPDSSRYPIYDVLKAIVGLRKPLNSPTGPTNAQDLKARGDVAYSLVSSLPTQTFGTMACARIVAELDELRTNADELIANPQHESHTTEAWRVGWDQWINVTADQLFKLSRGQALAA